MTRSTRANPARSHLGRRIRAVLVGLVLLFGLLVAPAQQAQAGTDDYPYKSAVACGYSAWCINGRWYSDWNFAYRNCTDFVAWRMRDTNGVDFHNWMGGRQWGNANNWDDTARALGYAVNGTPARGAIAQTDAGGYGHVAWVDSVNGDGTVTIEEYNYNVQGTFSRRTVAASAFKYIHIKDLSSWPPAEGSFVSVTDNGEVYRIAGGSPQYVTTWDVYGGPQPTMSISRDQLNSLPRVPANGTFINAVPNGGVFRVAGGAPLAVSNWDRFGGVQPYVDVDVATVRNAGRETPFNHLNATPTDMFLRGRPSGRIFRVVGGHPYYVATWDPHGGPQPYLDVDDWAIDNCDHLNCDPFGNLDAVTPEAGGARVRGWAMDPNVLDPVAIHVYSNGALAGSIPAARVSRPDVDSVFHRGAAFGFNFAVRLSVGTHRVCAFAINVGQGSSNPELGCQTVQVTQPATVSVIAKAPSFSDVCGTASDRYTIPSVTGVEYLVGGSVKAAGSYKASGTVTVTARAKAGYTLSGTTRWSKTFTNRSSFTDVSPGTQFFDEICWLSTNKISTGYPDGSFRPVQPVNRDAMAAFMYRLAGSPSWTPPARSPFRDVTPSTQFYKEITWLAARGITTGYDVPGGKEYRPLQPVNRDAMAAFMHRLAKSPKWTPPARSPFRDVTPSTQFYKEITWLASKGITTGYDVPGGKEYRPVRPVNRDAMAAFMYRLKVTNKLV